MAVCSFCDEQVQKGTGVMYVKKDGSLYNYCSSKCRKNSIDLGREGRRQKWTHAYSVFMGKEAALKEAATERKRVRSEAEELKKKEGKK